MGSGKTEVKVCGLKVEYLDTPLGLEVPCPRLSWRIESERRNVFQSAYRICVASSEEILHEGTGDLWDSGKVDSGKSLGVRYSGQPLTSRQRCWWRVQVWDEKGIASAPSASFCWEMGLLVASDWVAQWLAAEDSIAREDRKAGLSWIWGAATADTLQPRAFRRKFRLPLSSSGGEYFARSNFWFGNISGIWIDGISVAAEELDQSPQSPGRWLALQSMDAGEHLIAVEVTPRAPAFPSKVVRTDELAFFARLKLANGEMLRIGTDICWKTSALRDPGWHSAGYSDDRWEAVQLVGREGYEPWPARPAMYLRREFSLSKHVVKARLYATALGAYEARLNGRRVSKALLTPEPSQYDKRVLYRVYDVTELLHGGGNALGLIVGDGWYGSAEGRFEWGPPPRRVLAQLEMTFGDGSREVICTGPGWRVEESPIRISQVGIGEVYDARFESPGWDTAGFDDLHWGLAETGVEPSCRVVAQTSPPIRAMQILKPRQISEPRPHTYVFDFGENFAGYCRLHVTGAKGTRIELRFAELLTNSGEIDSRYSAGMGHPKRDVFILRGEASGETFQPRFTYRGFRYVEISGLPAVPTVESLEGIVVHSDLEMTGILRVDNPLIEAIWRNTVRTQCCNFVGIPTDCPSREQRGWMDDCGDFWDTASFNMDVCAFSSRQMDNAVDGQLADGAFPAFAPWPSMFASFITGPPGWADGSIILAWVVWQRYGDTAIIERNWDAMNRYLQFILDNNPDYLWKNMRGADYGDWFAPDQITFDPRSARATPKELVGTAYWAHSADLLAEIARAIGRAEDAIRLSGIFECVRNAFMEAYVTSEGIIGDGSQTCYVLALKFGLLPEATRRVAAERLASDIRRRGVALATGFLGTQFILDVLSDSGFTELAYSLLLRTEFPSWGYMLREGATTIWESWNGEIVYENKRVKVSQNHFALGSICGFMFRRIAGIDAASPGFETIVVRPALDLRVKHGGGEYKSIVGLISTDWRFSADECFALDVVIPANTIAHVWLPASRKGRITEQGVDVSLRKDVRMVKRLDHQAVIEIGSGRYSFLVVES